jgi:hypothetical protein
MMPAEKIGRVAWIGFIVLSAPCALFCSAMAVIALRMLCIENAGPIESLPPTAMEKCIAWTCLLTHPVLWTASLFFAHRLNGSWKATFPFVLNLVPIVGLLWFAYVVSSAESPHLGWPVWYLGTVAAFLVAGLVAVVLSSLRQPIPSFLSHP